jgi:uncharacterized protein (TIGR00255 family)
MLKSMTGFGSAEATVGAETMSVEIKSVNNKFCEVKVRLPRELSVGEPLLAKKTKDRLARGSIDVSIKRQTKTETGVVPVVDMALAREYLKTFRDVGALLGLSDEIRLRDVLQQSGVVKVEEQQMNNEDALKAAEQALDSAIVQLIVMREREGVALKNDLNARLQFIEQRTVTVRTLAPKTVESFKAKLHERIADLAGHQLADPQRLATEVALFAKAIDVAEELTRLDSHISQFRQYLEAPESIGRKLDFLVQEMHREVNTTGSKSQHATISVCVVEMKAELERIKEQVQNIE